MTEIKEAILRIEQEMKSLDGSISNKYWIIQGLHKAWEICYNVHEESSSKQLTYEEWKLKKYGKLDCDCCGLTLKYEEGSYYCNNKNCGNKGKEIEL